MEFRPCIDIHNGKVKQIIGGSLSDEGDKATDNFVAEKNADYYASLYKERQIRGGHVILLNAKDSPYYAVTKAQAMLALATYPGGLQVGGGINADNAAEFIEAGASHVIVTSYVFSDGAINFENLEKLIKAVGRGKIVLDLSCREKNNEFYIVTDRWQKWTDECLSPELLKKLADYCDEFLIHAVDVEGKGQGIHSKVLEILAKGPDLPITYAGGVHSLDDIRQIKVCGQDRVNVTVGSALDIFGGTLSMDDIMEMTIN